MIWEERRIWVLKERVEQMLTTHCWITKPSWRIWLEKLWEIGDGTRLGSKSGERAEASSFAHSTSTVSCGVHRSWHFCRIRSVSISLVYIPMHALCPYSNIQSLGLLTCYFIFHLCICVAASNPEMGFSSNLKNNCTHWQWRIGLIPRMISHHLKS